MFFDNHDVVTLITSITGGGIAGGVLTYIIKSKKEARTDFNDIIETFKEDNERLRIENNKLRLRVTELEAELVILRARLAVIEKMDIFNKNNNNNN